MSKVMSMASSTAFLGSLDVGDGPSEVEFVIMGFVGGADGKTGRDGGMLTGAGCCGAGFWPGSMRSGMTIICFPLAWNLSGCIESTRLMVFSP